MYKRAIGLATAAAISLSMSPATALAALKTAPASIATSMAAGSAVEGTDFELPPVLAETEPGTDTPTVETTAPSAPKKAAYRPKPSIKKGSSKAHVRNVMKKSKFKVAFKYANGPKNKVVRATVMKSHNKAPYRKYSKARKRYEYKEGVKFIVTLGNGKGSTKSWKTGTATWYSIADNTPRGSRATSSGKLLGWNGGWTFASRHFPLGTKLKVKGPNGRIQTVICTDRGGLHTIDLYKPASDKLGMNGKSKFKYQVVGKAF